MARFGGEYRGPLRSPTDSGGSGPVRQTPSDAASELNAKAVGKGKTPLKNPFTVEEAARLIELRDRPATFSDSRNGERELAHLRFNRWLVQQGKLSEEIE